MGQSQSSESRIGARMGVMKLSHEDELQTGLAKLSLGDEFQKEGLVKI